MNELVPIHFGNNLPDEEVKETEPGLKAEIKKQSLTVNGQVLTTEDPPEILQYVLTYNGDVIEKGVEEFKEYQQSLPQNKGAIVSRAPIIAMKLGPAKASLSKLGLENTNSAKTNIDEIKTKFHPYWGAIEAAGYIPEARDFYGKYGTALYLYFRIPEVEPSAE